jgi:hypothetical protein
MTDANRLNPEDRLERIESLMIQLGTISQARGQMVDDHDDRIQRLEQLNLTLGENLLRITAQNEAQLSRHDERISRLEGVAESLNASNERLDRIINYLIRRDGNQPE